LIRLGKQQSSIILESNGKHTLADSFTSIAVVAGLLLYTFTGLYWIDPLFGILIAFYIVYTGLGLCRRSFDGLMDAADPVITRQLTEILAQKCEQLGIKYHDLRHRYDGDRHIIDLHLLFPRKTEIGQAHRIACEIESCLVQNLSNRAHILTHLESLEDHEDDHKSIPESD
jgi:cation diffusion facilitator family transporter